MEIITIDVSQLAPPEPMTKILHALSQLTAEQCLEVKHSRQPYPLYEQLHQGSWCHYCQVVKQAQNQEQVFIYIYRVTLQSQVEQFIATRYSGHNL
ncbi:DUF2249 domain-containing protein [Colwellia sp. RSH04]|uniref:DUF2249 domain-containing protein n=1 Tax=Colwellia sp. RSH04 TaxID=2305464 RepID=UPI000E56A5F7|nr:DUF2249 domain-containing protein [Colwellia sp. RSH04]RHW75215.1 DUF2249 domain-containing protein [Colwellia sp. RSH04]